MRGSDIFDLFLVAQMHALEITVICTHNIKDFSGYRGVWPQTPETIIQGPPWVLHEQWIRYDEGLPGKQTLVIEKIMSISDGLGLHPNHALSLT